MTIDLFAELKRLMPTGIDLGDEPPHEAGGQGAIIRGNCDGRKAAIKLFSHDNDERRIIREIDALVKIDCPSIVKVLRHVQVSLDGETVHLVAYEWHGGGDLNLYATGPGSPLDAESLIRLGEEIGHAIDVLWENRMVHRDIKPKNIVKADDGRFVLVDFGLAKHLDFSNVTVIGAAPGTRGFRSPEQRRLDSPLTKQSDLYSLALTMVCLACQRHPFGNRDITEPMKPDLAQMQHRRDLPPDLHRLVAQMLQFKPYERPKTVREAFQRMREVA